MGSDPLALGLTALCNRGSLFVPGYSEVAGSRGPCCAHARHPWRRCRDRGMSDGMTSIPTKGPTPRPALGDPRGTFWVAHRQYGPEERMFDPLTAEFDSDELRRLRHEEPVSRTPSGSWFLARFDDVLAATKDPDTFIASFREPGIVVPEEEQLVNEIPRPRHGQIRRIINSAIAAHRVAGSSPSAAICASGCSATSWPRGGHRIS